MARRRKEGRRVGIASRGIVRPLGRFFSRVRHRGVPDRERVPERCHSSGSAMDVCNDAPAWAQRAERAVDGGVVYVSRALAVSPSAPRITAQRSARFDPYNTPQLLTTVEVTPRDIVGLGRPMPRGWATHDKGITVVYTTPQRLWGAGAR